MMTRRQEKALRNGYRFSATEVENLIHGKGNYSGEKAGISLRRGDLLKERGGKGLHQASGGGKTCGLCPGSKKGGPANVKGGGKKKNSLIEILIQSRSTQAEEFGASKKARGSSRKGGGGEEGRKRSVCEESPKSSEDDRHRRI